MATQDTAGPYADMVCELMALAAKAKTTEARVQFALLAGLYRNLGATVRHNEIAGALAEPAQDDPQLNGPSEPAS